MYKEASKQQLRITTTKGLLSVEQLWSLSIDELDRLAIKLQEEYDSSKGKSFVNKKSTKDKTTKLRFDIVLDVLNTKVEEREKSQTAAADRLHNQTIIARIQKNKDKELDNLSTAELEKLLR